jgi:hypothetical protein
MEFSGRAVQTAIITGVFSALGTFFVALRLWTRFVIVRAAGYEDFVLIASWVSTTSSPLHIFLNS